MVYCKDCANLPKCSYCREVIVENYLLANNMYWHKHHFYCQSCNKLIENKEFFVKNSLIICEICKDISEVEEHQEIPEPQETFGSQKTKYYTLKQLITKPYPTGIDITKREVNY